MLIYYGVIIICFLASLSVYFQKTAMLYLRLFPLFLALTIIVELVGHYMADNGWNTQRLYNFFTAFEFLFYMNAIREIVHSRRAKGVIFNCIWLYIIVVLINAIFVQKAGSFTSITYAMGCLLIVAFCIYYFYELFQVSSSLSLVRQPAFWICSGLLFFYCTSFPIYTLLNILKRSPDFFNKNYRVILLLLNDFLYSSFTIAFLCRLKIRKSIF